MKGIILAGGTGSRLFPLTLVTSKQLLPVHNKPMIYYPLTTLMQAGIKDILIISTPNDIPRFQSLLGNGSNFGIKLSYAIQERPEGLAQAFLIGEDFIGDSACALILGDNIFCGDGLYQHLRNASKRCEEGLSTLFGYEVDDPTRFGVIELDKNNNAISIEEKPKHPKSNYCVTGLYFYPNDVVSKAKTIKPSERNELEITSLNNLYLQEKRVRVELLDNNYKWLDTGTLESLSDATNFIKKAEKTTGKFIGCPEETAFQNGWIDKEKLTEEATKMLASEYGQHLKKLI